MVIIIHVNYNIRVIHVSVGRVMLEQTNQA